jgi:hypothetical protein
MRKVQRRCGLAGSRKRTGCRGIPLTEGKVRWSWVLAQSIVQLRAEEGTRERLPLCIFWVGRN